MVRIVTSCHSNTILLHLIMVNTPKWSARLVRIIPDLDWFIVWLQQTYVNWNWPKSSLNIRTVSVNMPALCGSGLHEPVHSNSMYIHTPTYIYGHMYIHVKFINNGRMLLHVLKWWFQNVTILHIQIFQKRLWK